MVRSGKSLALLAEADGRIVAVTFTIPNDRVHIVSAQLALDDNRDCYRSRAELPAVPAPIFTAPQMIATAEDDPGASPLGLYDLLQDRPLIAIRVLRQHLGMSRPEFAAIFGLDSQIVARWEQGLARPNPNHQALPELIAIVLQTIGCLLGRSDGVDANYLQVDIHQTYNNYQDDI